MSRAGGDSALGQLAGQGALKGRAGIARSGHAHGLIDIRPARQGIADRAAQAGGRAAEGLQSRWGGYGSRSLNWTSQVSSRRR